MYVNGQLELSATDSSLTAGAAGLVTLKSIAKYDNVSVNNLSVVPTTPTPSATPTPTPTVQPTTAPSSSPTVTPTPTPSPTAGQTGEYHLTGFAQGNTGGGALPETDAAYIKVYNATDLAVALKKGSGYKVVEIMNDLDLGWNEIPAAAKVSPFAAHNSALTHPVLLHTGVSKISVDGFTGLTIFSANGATIKHAALHL